jgi:hypothetical protein
MDAFLRTSALAAAVWAAAGLAFLWLRARAFGRREVFARPAGSVGGGVIYAFTRGMLPWAKESVRGHLPSFLLGTALHLGIFSGLALLAAHLAEYPAARLLGFPYPPFGDNAGVFLYINKTDDVTASARLVPLLPALLLALGAIGGASLLAKRLSDPMLRGISCPDDYISNFLATAFAATALASALMGQTMGQTWATRSFYVASVALFLYLPLGKMRHCLFFFTTRRHFGEFFGRRGCMPPAPRTAGPRRQGA